MHEIERVLRRAGRRLLVVDLLHTLTVTITIGAGALILALLLERVFGIGVAWREAFIAAGLLAVVGAVAWSLVRRARGVALARELDERAGLRESLSTALCVSRADDPWSRAVVETARARAVRVVVRDAVPIEAPRLLPVPMGALLALMILWFVMPSLDLSGRQAQLAQDEAREQEVVEAKRDVQEMEEELDKLLEKANVELEAEAEADTPEDPEADADEVRLSAIRKLTRLEDQLKEAAEGQKAKQAEAMRQMTRRLRTPGPGPLDEMSKALAQGDFGQAKKALEELAEKLASGELSEAEREAAQKQLQDMARQLEKLAEQQQKLEEMLKEAGLDSESAKAAMRDPEALKQAMDKLDNLSDQQKQALMDRVQAQQGAAKQCQGLSEGLSKMGMAAGAGKMGQMQEGAGQAAGMLSEMEMMEGELMALEASLDGVSQCMGRLAGQCSNPGQGKWGQFKGWKAGDTNRLGDGSGGPGRGNGPSPDEAAADYTIEKDKANVKRKSGPITGQRWVFGNQVRGESRKEFAQAARSASASAAEALETMQVEPEFRDAVQNYFGTLERESEEDAKDGQ